MQPEDIFKFKLVGDEETPFLGYNSTSDKSRLKAGHMIRGSKNVIKKISGNIASRCGRKRRGTVNTTSAPIDSSFEWISNIGVEHILRVQNGKLQVESNIVDSGVLVWYDLLEMTSLASPAATYSRFVFDTWWDADDESDRLVYVRGDSTISSWSGAMAIVSSVTANSITIKGTSTIAEKGFALSVVAEKKIIINSIEFTYTDDGSTTTFTIPSGDTSSISAGMVIIQSVITFSDLPVVGYKADFLKTIGNQLVVGSYSSRAIYISSDDKGGGFPDFSNSGSHISGDPDDATLDNLGKGFGTKDGKLVAFAGNADLYEITLNEPLPVSYTGSDSQSRFVYTKVVKKQLPGLNSALGHEFIGNIGDYLVWIDQKNQLRALGSFTNDNFVKPTTLSLPVQTELSEDDFTGGHLRCIGDTIHISAPNTGRDWMYQMREKLNDDGSILSEKLWQPPQVRGISRFAIIGGVLHGHENANPQIYQLDDTNQWFDDAGDSEEIPYTCVARFSYMQHGRREGMEKFDMVFFEGYMAKGTALGCNIYLDYQGAEAQGATGGLRQVVISDDENPAKSWSNLIPPSFGGSTPGDNPFGDGILAEASDQEIIPKFRSIANVPQPKNFFEYALEVFSTDVDARWELNCLGANVRLASQSPTFLRI